MTMLVSIPAPWSPQVSRPAPASRGTAHLRVIGRHGGRFLQILDLENLVGGWASPKNVRTVLECYAGLGLVRPGDQCIAAVSRRFAASLFEAPQGWLKRVSGNEKDAADRALLSDVPVEWVAERFDGLVIASGDEAFTDLATGCRRAGLRVTTVRGKGWMSTALYLAGQHHVSLPCELLTQLV